jgi:hypothetical protein
MAVLVRSNSEELPKAIGSERNGEDPTHVGLPIIAFTVHLTWELACSCLYNLRCNNI